MQIAQIKSYMKHNKITYEQLSKKSEIPLNTLKNIFSGRTPNPRIDTVQAIEKALGLDTPQWTAEDRVLGVQDTITRQLPLKRTMQLPCIAKLA